MNGQHGFKHHLRLGVLTVMLGLGLAGCAAPGTPSTPSSSLSSETVGSPHKIKGSSSSQAASSSSSNVATDTSQLAQLNYQSGQAAYINVNNGKSTLDPQSFKTVSVQYQNLDRLNRTSGQNLAYLDQRNLANDSLRTTQTVRPTGWHQKFVNNEAILNRGHEIAYSLSKGIDVDGHYNPAGQSGDQNNPKNLFTQTAFANQKVQTIFESKVRNALRDGKKVIYAVQPIFNGSDLMAKGVQLQAVSTDGSLNFNVYVFNVQPGIKFNYADGTSQIDHDMQVPTPAGAPTFNDDRSRSNRHRYVSHHYVSHAITHAAIHHIYTHHFHHHF